MRAGSFQKIRDNAVDLRDFKTNIFDDRAGGARRGQIATDNFDHSRDASQRIANFVSQARRQFPESGEVFGARHLSAMESIDLVAALPQLLHHMVEIAAEISDLVIATREADSDIQIAVTHLPNLLLQFHHRPLHEIGEHQHRDGTDGNSAGSSNDEYRVTIRVAQRYGCESEQDQPSQKHESYRQDRFELPVHAHGIRAHGVLP